MEEFITLAHGSGGRKTSELIGNLFKKYFANDYLIADDAAVLPGLSGRIAMTPDGFIVSPCEFPGGNIGKLSICGTVNDLACMGARPSYLTCSFVIEEGFPVAKLEEIAAAMAKTAKVGMKKEDSYQQKKRTLISRKRDLACFYLFPSYELK